MNKYFYLTLEFFVVFILLPISIYIFEISLNHLVIPILLIFVIICVIILFNDNEFDRTILYRLGDKKILRLIFIRWFIGIVLLPVGVYFFDRELLFSLPITNPLLWIMVIIAYPLLSVYPQELLFRVFFFHRYAIVFKSEFGIILASSISFGLAHLFFNNWIAPILSIVGGYLFANTYSKSKSLMVSVIEHSLWGDLIFTVGLGYYFYAGNKM